ncbi:hypothetical protein, partial [Thiolapillus sp.]
RSEAYFVFPLAQGTPGKQCGLAATGVYQPSLRSPWLAAYVVLFLIVETVSAPRCTGVMEIGRIAVDQFAPPVVILRQE